MKIEFFTPRGRLVKIELTDDNPIIGKGDILSDINNDNYKVKEIAIYPLVNGADVYVSKSRGEKD